MTTAGEIGEAADEVGDLVYSFTPMEMVLALIQFAVARGDAGPAGFSLTEMVLEGSSVDGFTLTLPAHTRRLSRA